MYRTKSIGSIYRKNELENGMIKSLGKCVGKCIKLQILAVNAILAVITKARIMY